MSKKYDLIQIADEKPDSAEEEMIQLGFALTNLFNEVEKTLLMEGLIHPLAAVQPVGSSIITVPDPTGKRKVRLVGVTIPFNLIEKIKDVALEVVAQRLVKEGGDDG